MPGTKTARLFQPEAPTSGPSRPRRCQVPGHISPPTQAGQHSNPRSGRRDRTTCAPSLVSGNSGPRGRKSGEHYPSATYSRLDTAVHSHGPVLAHERVSSGLGTATRGTGQAVRPGVPPATNHVPAPVPGCPARTRRGRGPAACTKDTDSQGGKPGPGARGPVGRGHRRPRPHPCVRSGRW